MQSMMPWHMRSHGEDECSRMGLGRREATQRSIWPLWGGSPSSHWVMPLFDTALNAPLPNLSCHLPVFPALPFHLFPRRCFDNKAYSVTPCLLSPSPS